MLEAMCFYLFLLYDEKHCELNAQQSEGYNYFHFDFEARLCKNTAIQQQLTLNRKRGVGSVSLRNSSKVCEYKKS